jgi:ATP-dependent RNA/DNA helicase IGHMBP2
MQEFTVREFVARQRDLLELELNAEQDEEKSIASLVDNKGLEKDKNGDDDERPSHVLRHLEPSEISVGLYGRTMVTLTVLEGREKSATSALLPAHRFSVGDETEIHSKQKSANKEAIGGVISAVTDTSITIALYGKRASNINNNEGNDEDEEDSLLGPPPLTIIPRSSVEVHRKLIKSLDELQRDGADHKVAGSVIDALFGQPKSFPEFTYTPIEPFNKNLDTSQLEAICFALNGGERPISLIHGPPGTGKTTTIAELIRQAVYVHNYKVLVTAPSNVAVDNVLSRLISDQPTGKAKRSKRKDRQAKLKTVRLGHPARIHSNLLPFSLESLVQNAEGTEIVSDVRGELQAFLRILANPKSRGADKRVAYREIKALRKEIKAREQKVVKDLIQEAQVVLATNVGAANYMLNSVEFDLVVIDEAAQALEASCWIPILRGKRLVLAGDHCQLPPTIKSKASKVQKGLGKTLFERTMELYGDNDCPNEKGNVSRMLQVQYRMHSDIAGWASKVMYNGQLQTHESVGARTLSQLPHVTESSDVDVDDDIQATTLLLIDTAGCDMHETANAAGSRYNDGEAQLVAQHVRSLLEIGLQQDEIAIISPYNGQVDLLRTMLLPDAPKLEIRSVDGFQGGEREAVVLSLVRSSDRAGCAGIGFLRDDRRLNVAVTRAKRHCAVVCDSETVTQSKFINGLVDWMASNGLHRSAVEFLSSPQDGISNSDMHAAEMEILRVMDTTSLSAGNGVKPKLTKQTDRSTTPSMSSRGEQHRQDLNHKKCPKADEEERRKAMLDKITAFAEEGKNGDEMRLSSDLSRFDRRVVHEFATQLGLDHHSEGTDGVDRKIILKIKEEVAVDQNKDDMAIGDVNEKDVASTVASTPSAFSALHIESDDSSEASNASTKEQQADVKPLAKQRQQRHIQQSKQTGQSKTVQEGGGKKKKTKNKGQKLGFSTSNNKNENTATADDIPDDLDDMAFLDSQIEKVQSSHGRKVDGKGEYRTIVNGILISKPTLREREKDQQASSALRAKLKQTQDGRKAKRKPNK